MSKETDQVQLGPGLHRLSAQVRLGMSRKEEPMKLLKQKGILQIAAGIALLRKSNLVVWDEKTLRFTTGVESEFEQDAAHEDRLFGRLFKWMQFSAGYEFLLKGCLLLDGNNFLGKKDVLAIPKLDEVTSPDWLVSVKTHSARKEEVASFGTLGTLTHRPNNGRHNSLLEKFLDHRMRNTCVCQTDCDRVFAVSELLRDAIRNRDAHAYVPNVRKQGHQLVHLFVPALNTLLEFIADDSLLSSHRIKAATIIAELSDDPHTRKNVSDEMQESVARQHNR